MIQIGVCTTFCEEEGILLQKHRDKNGRRIAILFKRIGVEGRFDSPDFHPSPTASLLSAWRERGRETNLDKDQLLDKEEKFAYQSPVPGPP